MCHVCGDPLTSHTEFDHIVRLGLRTGEKKFQALHASCHAAKTTDEEKRLNDHPLTSHFSNCTWASLCNAPPLQVLTFCAKEVQALRQGALILDVRRCRKRALEFCADDLAVFSPLDSAVEVNDFQLGGFMFVNAPCSTFTRQYGYSGPGWIHKCLARWLLHVNVIQWKRVRYCLTATAHLPHSCLREPLEIIENCWEDSAGAKLAVNSVIGLWMRKPKTFIVSTSDCPVDAPEGESVQRTIQFGEDKHIHNWVQEKHIVGLATNIHSGSW